MSIPRDEDLASGDDFGDTSPPIRPYDERFKICDLMTKIGYAKIHEVHQNLPSRCSFDLLMAWMDGKFDETYAAWVRYIDSGAFSSFAPILTVRHGMRVPPIHKSTTDFMNTHAEQLDKNRNRILQKTTPHLTSEMVQQMIDADSISSKLTTNPNNPPTPENGFTITGWEKQ